MNRNILLAAGGAALVAGTVGIIIGRNSQSPAPVAAEAEAAPNEVAFSAEQLRSAGITLVRVESQALGGETIASGTVSAETGAEASLPARADGAVVRLFKRLGDPVRAGETVALIESQEAATIAAQRSTAQANLQVARARYAREARLFAERVTARQDLETARAELASAQAEARRTATAAGTVRVSGDGRTLAVVSPTHGRISAAPATLGAFVTGGTELFRVVDPARVELRIAVPAAEAGRIVPGARATIELSEGVTFPAVVRSVTPGADPVSRAATAVLVPVAGAPVLRPGQGVRARIASVQPAGAATLVVPAEAVQLLDGREVVFVRTTRGFRARPVVVGRRTADRVEILSGLSAGVVIAGRNAFLVKAELAKGTEEGE